MPTWKGVDDFISTLSQNLNTNDTIFGNFSSSFCCARKTLCVQQQLGFRGLHAAEERVLGLGVEDRGVVDVVEVALQNLTVAGRDAGFTRYRRSGLHRGSKDRGRDREFFAFGKFCKDNIYTVLH